MLCKIGRWIAIFFWALALEFSELVVWLGGERIDDDVAKNSQ
jgi:hypothetical protein